MDIINEYSESVSWIRYVLNPASPMPKIVCWQKVFDFSIKQKITGVCDPTKYKVCISKDILFKWITLIQQIRHQSALLNKRTVELAKRLGEAGFRCCILKGQGNAEMYPDPLMRMPGDIDVWVDADEKEIIAYVQQQFPEIQQTFKHIKFPIFSDIPVDVHNIPLKLYHPGHQRKLQEWIERQKEEQFSHRIQLTDTDTEISVPTTCFNAVYQLGHILIHLLDEGIGLRHLIDYYYVLKELEGVPESEKEQIRKEWREMGMCRLATAVMWVEQQVLGLPENCLLMIPDKNRGNILLQEIMEGGNFGKYSQRQTYKNFGFFIHRTAKAWHLLKISALFPGESVYRMISKVKTAFVHYRRK